MVLHFSVMLNIIYRYLFILRPFLTRNYHSLFAEISLFCVFMLELRNAKRKDKNKDKQIWWPDLLYASFKSIAQSSALPLVIAAKWNIQSTFYNTFNKQEGLRANWMVLEHEFYEIQHEKHRSNPLVSEASQSASQPSSQQQQTTQKQ